MPIRGVQTGPTGHDQGDFDDLALISEAARRLIEASRPDEMIDDLYRQLSEQLHFEVYFHYLYRPEERRLFLQACGGIGKDLAEQIRWLEMGEAVCGTVAQQRQALVVNQIQDQHDRKSALVRSMGIRAYCCHPLLAGDELIGTLSFGTKTRDRFSGRELRLLRVICDLVAVSIQRSRTAADRDRLLANEREARQELQAALSALNELTETLEERVTQRTQALIHYQGQLRSLASELILTEQQERRRIASELHDHLAQLLVACKMKLGAVRDQPACRGIDTLEEIDQFLNQSLVYTRTLIAQISPIALYERGLVSAVRWLAETFTPQHELKVEVDAEGVDENICETLGDDLRIMLFESVRELLFNVARHADTDTAVVRLRSREEELQISVTDAGAGFDPEHAKRSDPGTVGGYGLFSIQERMAVLGGRFEVSSSPGEGTHATLAVPLQPADEEADADLAPARAARPVPARQKGTSNGEARGRGRGSSTRVLVVDDHAVVREGLLMMLDQEEGVVVVGEAENGHEALDLAGQLQPDVVLMDVSMPGLSGVETTSRLTRAHPDVHVIGLSMYDDEDVANSMRAAGAAAYLCKGCSADLLTQTIRRVIRGEAAGNGNAAR